MRDYIEDRMRGIRRQPQRVKSFPGSNADVRGIEIRTLLGKLLVSLFGALRFLVSEAFGRSSYEVVGAGRRHVSSPRLNNDAGRLGGPHRIARDPGPR